MTNYEKYFGTPERAAFTIYVLDCEDGEEIEPTLCESIVACAAKSIDSILEWLESEADHD